MGGDAIFERLKEHLDVGNDETTADGRITLEHVECNAACDYAPVVMVNWEFVDNQTPQSAVELVDDLRNGVERHSTRGPRLCTWREAERVLAGFNDGRADEGPSAGPASLAGLSIARENGWTAPDAGGDPEGAPAGRAASASERVETKDSAVAEADTQRAGAETVAEQDVTEAKPGAPTREEDEAQ
jgi:NADH-quinone oxidoreductase subunit E